MEREVILVVGLTIPVLIAFVGILLFCVHLYRTGTAAADARIQILISQFQVAPNDTHAVRIQSHPSRNQTHFRYFASGKLAG